MFEKSAFFLNFKFVVQFVPDDSGDSDANKRKTRAPRGRPGSRRSARRRANSSSEEEEDDDETSEQSDEDFSDEPKRKKPSKPTRRGRKPKESESEDELSDKGSDHSGVRLRHFIYLII